MPLSIRLKPVLEQRIAEYAARNGIPKSSVIAQGVEEYLDRNAGPMLYELYQPIVALLSASPAAPRRAARGPLRERYVAYVKAKHARRTRR